MFSTKAHYCNVIKTIKYDYNNKCLKSIAEYNLNKCSLDNKDHIKIYYNFITDNNSQLNNTNIFFNLKNCDTFQKVKHIKNYIKNISDEEVLKKLFYESIDILKNGDFFQKIFITDILTIFRILNLKYTEILFKVNGKRLNEYNIISNLLEDESDMVRYNALKILYIFYNKKYYNFIIKNFIYSLNDTIKIQKKILKYTNKIIETIDNYELKILLRNLKDSKIRNKILKVLSKVHYDKEQRFYVLNELNKHIKEKEIDIFEYLDKYRDFYTVEDNFLQHTVSNYDSYENNKTEIKILELERENKVKLEEKKKINLEEDKKNIINYNDKRNKIVIKKEKIDADKKTKRIKLITKNEINTKDYFFTDLNLYKRKSDNRIFNTMNKIVKNKLKHFKTMNNIDNKPLRVIIEYYQNKNYDKDFVFYLRTIEEKNIDNYKEYVIDYITNYNSSPRGYYNGLFKILKYPRTETEIFYKSILSFIKKNKNIKLINLFFNVKKIIDSEVKTVEDIKTLISHKNFAKIKQIKYKVKINIKTKDDMVFVDIKGDKYINIYYRIYYNNKTLEIESNEENNIYFNLSDEAMEIEIVYKKLEEQIILKKKKKYFIF